MAQIVVSWFIYDGAIRVHAINGVGRRKGRIIEVEVVDTGERFHGSARRLDRLVQDASKVRRRDGPCASPKFTASDWAPHTLTHTVRGRLT